MKRTFSQSGLHLDAEWLSAAENNTGVTHGMKMTLDGTVYDSAATIARAWVRSAMVMGSLRRLRVCRCTVA